MVLTRWSPLREIEEFQSEMDRLFTRFAGTNGNHSVAPNNGGLTGTWVMPIDVTERQDGIVLRAALPGVNPDDISVELEDQVLTLRAERRFNDNQGQGTRHWVEQTYGTFTRTLTLPKYADGENIQARYENGVLELTIPKRETAKPRKIELQRENGSGAKALEPASSAS